VWQRDRHALS